MLSKEAVMGDSMVKATVAFDRSKYEELERIASTRRCTVNDRHFDDVPGIERREP